MRDPAHPFHFVHVSAGELRAGAAAGAIQRMIDQRMDGIIVRGLFSPEECARAIGRLSGLDLPRRRFGDPALEAPAEALGITIVSAARELDGYFADGAAQRGRVQRLFDGESFEARIEGALSALGGGLPVEVAHARDGRTCPSATIRVLPDGGEIGVHVGNEFMGTPAATELREFIDLTSQLSYFVTLAAPEAGGELIVYDLEWSAARLFMHAPAEQPNVWLEGTPPFEFITSRPATAFAPRSGDLLVFDGGRYFHRVAKVRGATPRHTIGGFLGLSRGRDRVYYWS